MTTNSRHSFARGLSIAAAIGAFALVGVPLANASTISYYWNATSQSWQPVTAATQSTIPDQHLQPYATATQGRNQIIYYTAVQNTDTTVTARTNVPATTNTHRNETTHTATTTSVTNAQVETATTTTGFNSSGRIRYDAGGNAYWENATTTVATPTPVVAATSSPTTVRNDNRSVSSNRSGNRARQQQSDNRNTNSNGNQNSSNSSTQTSTTPTTTTTATTQSSSGGGYFAGHYAYTADGAAYWQPETTPQ